MIRRASSGLQCRVNIHRKLGARIFISKERMYSCSYNEGNILPKESYYANASASIIDFNKKLSANRNDGN